MQDKHNKLSHSLRCLNPRPTNTLCSATSIEIK